MSRNGQRFRITDLDRYLALCRCGYTHLIHRPFFDLPDSLCRNAILFGQISKGLLLAFFGQPARPDDLPAPVIQAGQRLAQLGLPMTLLICLEHQSARIE